MISSVFLVSNAYFVFSFMPITSEIVHTYVSIQNPNPYKWDATVSSCVLRAVTWNE